MQYQELQNLKGSTVLVTGGAGFIGSNLIETLLEHDMNVVCLDNFATGKRANIAPFLSNPNFKLIEGKTYQVNGKTLRLKISHHYNEFYSIMYYFMKDGYSNELYELKFCALDANF